MASYLSKRRELLSRQGLLLFLLALAISVVCAWLAHQRAPENLNWLLYDQTQLLSRLPPADNIVVIEVDDLSINELGAWPWPRSQHASLINRLDAAGAKLIVFDILFPERNLAHPASDESFAAAIQSSGKVILPLFFETPGAQATVVETPPARAFLSAAAAIGHVHVAHEYDGVVRGVFLKEGINTPFWPHLALATLAQTQSHMPTPLPGQKIPQGSPDAISLTRDFYNLVPMPAADQGIRHFSYVDVVRDNVPGALLADKIVFVGATATGLGDLLTTPVGTMHGVELNAWIFHALQHQKLIIPSASWLCAVATFLLVFCLVMLLGRLSPRLFLLFSVLGIAGLIVLTSLLLLKAKIWFPNAAAVIGVALFFPLWSWLRAESMLRYLRNEIAQLPSADSMQGPRAIKQPMDFFTRLGLINQASNTLTEAGQQALARLRPDIASNGMSALEQVHESLSIDASEPDITQGSQIGVELISRTITRLSLAQKRDRRHRHLIEQSLSGLQDAVCICALNGAISYCNERFREWFRIVEMDDQNMELLALLEQVELHTAQRWPMVLQALFLEKPGFAGEGSMHVTKRNLQNSTDSVRHLLCHVNLTQTRSEYSDTLIFTFTDVSQLKRAEQARAEALSFLSHDLRSPMVSVLAIFDRLNATKNGLPADDVKHAEVLVRKNLDYAESFLQLSKADNLQTTSLEPCDLHAVLDTAQVHAKALAAPKSILVTTQRCNDDAWVLGEFSLLERAVNNLISNAVKFSPPNSEVLLCLYKTDAHACISVQDQGPGIAPEQEPRLFTRFARNRNDNAHGAGLGLNFVATVIRKCGGEIAVNSTPGQGACFSIALPALNEERVDSAGDHIGA